MVKAKSTIKTRTKDVQPLAAPLSLLNKDAASASLTNVFPPFRYYKDIIRQESEEFLAIKKEYYKRLREAPKIEESLFCKNYPIGQPSLGPPVQPGTRPISQLPPHIIRVLNDHYVALTKGQMIPEADLYNHGDTPVEQPMPTILDEREYVRFIQEIEEEEQNQLLLAQSSSSSSSGGPQVNPYGGQYLRNGEIIGVFHIVGTGPTTRAVCLKTKEVFTAQVLPRWKVPKVFDVIKRLQQPANMASFSADQLRLSEICVSRRMEILHSDQRWIIFNPYVDTTIHSLALARLDEITESEVMEIFKKLVEVIQFCHSRRVLVRNFRPKNFYLKKAEDGSWIVRPANLQDLGCDDEVTDAHNSRRTVYAAFMAPEMLKATTKTLHTYDTEMWGLGVLMYILLVGKYPFYEKETTPLFRAIKFKQQKWPMNFLSFKATTMVDMMLRKVPSARMNLVDLARNLEGEFPNVRCRSNMMLKQHDLMIKMDLLEMYYDAYKGRLLPQNVDPIHEELLLCRHEFPMTAEFAKKDIRLVFETIKAGMDENVTGFQKTVMRRRLDQINQVLMENGIRDAQAENRKPKNIQFFLHELSKEILLPSVIYPVSDHYHPSQNPKDWIAYKALRDANQLAFPVIMRGTTVKQYPAPQYKGRVVPARR
ncbi:unnamed protein product [Caenorhabditis nigoni]